MSNYYKSLHFENIIDRCESLNSQDLRKINTQISQFPKDSKVKMEITLYDEKKEQERKRTEQQNKYYHKLLDIISDHTGDTHMDLHTALKCMFLSRPYVIGEKEYTIVGSTTTLNSKNFSKYLERVFSWASEELGLVLPTP